MDGFPEIFPHIPLHGYRLDMCLGEGALTTVYRGRKQGGTEEGSSVLITFLRLPGSFSEAVDWRFRERFWQMAERLAALRHPHLLPLVGYGERNGICYLAMEDITEAPLAPVLTQRMRWSPQEALALITPAAEMMTLLSRQLLPALFFDPVHLLSMPSAPDSSRLMLTGLLLSALFQRNGLVEPEQSKKPLAHLLSIAGHYLGHPAYLAPEQVRGEPATERSVIYSLGVLLFALLSGAPPFGGTEYGEIAAQHVYMPLPSLQERVSHLPTRIEVVLNRALSRDPALRFPTADALVAAYRSSLEGHEGMTEQALDTFHRVVALRRPTTQPLRFPLEQKGTERQRSSVQNRVPARPKEEAPGKVTQPPVFLPEERGAWADPAARREPISEPIQIPFTRLRQQLQEQQEAMKARIEEQKERKPEASSQHDPAGTEWLN